MISYKKIIIIQPAIPKYREELFNMLSKKYDVIFYTCLKDFNGVTTTYLQENIHLESGFYNFKFFFWHRKLPFLRLINSNSLVIINGNIRIINYLLIILLRKFFKKKTVVWSHGMTAGSFGIMFKIRRAIMNIPDALLLYTDNEKDLYNRNSLYALNNGLCSTKINEAKNKIINASGLNSNISDSVTNLIFIGRLTTKSNLEHLLRSLKLVKERCELIIIGDGPRKSYLEDLARTLNINDRVKFVGEHNDENKIASFMLRSDVFIYPGSVGLSLIHAFNYGLPSIIYSDMRYHMPEAAAFKEHFNGISFKKDSVTSLARSIDMYAQLKDDQKYQMSKNALETVKQSYNIIDMHSRFCKCIEDTIL